MFRSGRVAIRRVAVVVCVFAVVFSSVARADVITFRGKGALSGIVAEVVFRLDGKIVKYARQDISMLHFSTTGEDSLTLTAGKKKVTGTIVTVVVKTDRGKMRLRGRDLRDVVLESDPLKEAQRSILAARRAKIAPEDGKGLLELAKWARERELAAEAEELAKAAIETGLKSDAADEAHKFLGHVLFEGEWMPKAEMEKRKKNDEGLPPSADGNAAKVVKPKVSDDAADNAELKKAEDMATPAEQNTQACSVFLAKVARSHQRRLKSVNGVYNATRKRLNAQIAKEQAIITKATSERGSAGGYTSAHVRDTSGNIASSKGDKAIARAKVTMAKVKTQRARLAIARRRKVASMTKKTSRRKKRVLAVKAAIKKKLVAGEKITLTQMIASYKKVVQ